jgi:carboxymethylenebutenolidase
MCYDDNARPPLPPDANGTSHGEDVVLTANDGNRFAAYVAIPSNPTGAQILIYPDVRGLHQFYKELALRFAEVGVAAIAMDYFGRTAGLTSRAEPFDFWPHVQQLQFPTIIADAQASLAHLQTVAGTSQGTFIVGFCLGGTLTFLTGTEDNIKLNGLIGFYAGMSRKLSEEKGTLLEAASHIKYPVLGLFGGADQGIPPEQVQEFDENLDKAGVEHTIVSYAGAPHSFFDRRSADFAEAATDAWNRTLSFIKAHSSK